MKLARYSSVCIATHYVLGSPGVESRRGKFVRILPNRPWGPPSLLYIGYSYLSRGLGRTEPGVGHTPSSSAEVKERVQWYVYLPSRPLWPVLGWILPDFTFTKSQLRICRTLYPSLPYISGCSTLYHVAHIDVCMREFVINWNVEYAHCCWCLPTPV